MVTTAEALLVLFPAAEPGVDWQVTDPGDGSGESITFWDPALGTEPTPAQLAAVTEQQVIDAKKALEPDLYDLSDRLPQMITDHDTYLALVTPTQNQKDRQIRDLTQNQKRLLRAVVRLMEKDGIS